MENISHSEMERILLEQPDMQVSTHILDMNNQEETIWNVSVMYFSTSWKAHSLGKVYQEDQRLKNMLTSKRRRKKSKSKISARTVQKNSKNTCITAEDLPLLKIQTMATSLVCSKVAWKDTDSTLELLTSFGIKIDSLWKKKQSRDKCSMLSTRKPQPKRMEKLPSEFKQI